MVEEPRTSHNFVLRVNKRRNLTSQQWATLAIEAEEIVKTIKEETERQRREKQAQTLKDTHEKGEFGVSGNFLPETKESELTYEYDDDYSTRTSSKLAKTFNTNRTYITEARKLKETSPETVERSNDGQFTVSATVASTVKTADKIAEEFNISLAIIDLHFEDEDEVCEWMLTNQLGRRNLEPNIKTLLIGQLYELQKKRHGGDRKSDGFQEENQVVTVTTWSEPIKTSQSIAQQFGVSEKTVRNAGKVAEAFEKAPEPIKKQFQQGTISQKKLVETVAPKPQPKPTINEILDDSRTDEWTRLCKDYGLRFQKIIREFEALKSEMMLTFGKGKFPLEKFARNLITTDLKGQNTEAYFSESDFSTICKMESLLRKYANLAQQKRLCLSQKTLK